MATRHIVVGAGAGASLMAIAMTTIVPAIQGFEGTRAQAYRDIGGVLTVCTGHTGPDVVVGKVYSPDQCARLTAQDAQKAADGVLKVSPHLIYHPIQLASAVSFSYNVGVGAYSKSTVATKFNEGDFIGACNYLLNYKYINGQVSQGLLNRRLQEQALCLSTLTPKGLASVQSAPNPAK
jgi:lysozyme